MKEIVRRILGVVVVLLIFGCVPIKPKTPLDQIPGQIAYTPLRPEQWQLENGLTILFLPDEELPLVGGNLFIKGGSYWDQGFKLGVVKAMGDLMRDGGTLNLSAGELDRQLDELAASIGSGFAGEEGTVSFNCLAADFEKVFALFADVVLNPRFSEDRIGLWKSQTSEAIRRRNDDPSTIASISFNSLLYGNTAYGRVLTEDIVAGINRLDILRAHRKFVVPNKAILAVSGSIAKDKLADVVRKYFGKWEASLNTLGNPPGINFQPTPGIYFIEKPLAQSTIYLGHRGPKRLSPDYPAIEIFNSLFGAGGFGARLTQEVRVKRGLAYGIFGGILADVVEGKNIIALQTKTESTVEAIEASLNVLSSLQTHQVDIRDIKQEQNAVQNTFVFKFDSLGEIVKRHAFLQLREYPSDYDKEYIPKILSVTSKQVQEVAVKHWRKEDFVVVVVGNETAYNLLVAEVQTNDSPLAGFVLKKVKFDTQLIL